MKKSIIAAAMAAFIFTSCSEQKTDTTATTGDHTQEHATTADKGTDANAVVVEAPDYTAAAAPVKEQVAAVVNNYLKLTEGMVASDASRAQMEAKALFASAEKVDVNVLEGEQKEFAAEKLGIVKQHAGRIAEAADIEAQRNHLEPLSEATFALTKAFGATDKKLYYQHCPMALNDKGAYWISSKEEILNPYFGDKMLHCGTNEEEYN